MHTIAQIFKNSEQKIRNRKYQYPKIILDTIVLARKHITSGNKLHVLNLPGSGKEGALQLRCMYYKPVRSRGI